MDPSLLYAAAGAPKEPDVGEALTSFSGLTIVQKSQWGEALLEAAGVAYQAQNKYSVAAIPPGIKVRSSPDDAAGWNPSSQDLERLETWMKVEEESSCIMRSLTWICGVANLRPLKLHFSLKRGTGEVFVAKRPFKCGGGLCCPLEMDLFSANDGRPIGRVRENFSPYFSKCYAVCCLATMYHDIEVAVPGGGFITKYTLRANLACCGRVNNCCGGTCCKDNAVYDILDTSGAVVAHVQKTYARGLGACCRLMNMFDNYLLEFPAGSTADERALLLTSIFQLDYQVFEKKGGNSNN